jgi:hypothetical protein
VNRVAAAEFTILFQFKPILRGPFVLGRRVISLLALSTGQRNNASHEFANPLSL